MVDLKFVNSSIGYSKTFEARIQDWIHLKRMRVRDLNFIANVLAIDNHIDAEEKAEATTRSSSSHTP